MLIVPPLSTDNQIPGQLLGAVDVKRPSQFFHEADEHKRTKCYRQQNSLFRPISHLK